MYNCTCMPSSWWPFKYPKSPTELSGNHFAAAVLLCCCGRTDLRQSFDEPSDVQTGSSRGEPRHTVLRELLENNIEVTQFRTGIGLCQHLERQIRQLATIMRACVGRS